QWILNDGIRFATGEPNFGNPNVLNPELVIIVPGKPTLAAAPQQPDKGGEAAPLAGSGQKSEGEAGGQGTSDGSQGGKEGKEEAVPTGEPEGGAPAQRQANNATGIWFPVDPFAVLGTQDQSAGIRVRAQTVVSPAFLELGVRAARIDDANQLRLSEGNAI